jgi:hypothetical protein
MPGAVDREDFFQQPPTALAVIAERNCNVHDARR